MSLRGKTAFITGASRGIGLAIALRLARAGANIAIAAKTKDPHPKLPGTIFTAAAEVEKNGSKALPLVCDIRSESEVQAAIEKTYSTFGGIDIVVNNASAISLTPTLETTVKRFDLMNQVNSRGTWMVSKYALPHLIESAKRGRNPHILVLSPPLDMREQWFAPHTAYTMAKYGMSMVVLGLAGELREHGIAVNALWPLTAISTAAISNVLGTQETLAKTRKPEIMADAAYVIVSQESKKYTGNFVIDEAILRYQGVTDFSHYRVDPNCKEEDIMPDFFIPENPFNLVPPPKQVLKESGSKL